MRLAAIFIENHDYENGGYTINFGGNYHYDLKFGDGSTRISRSKNENFLSNFFDDTGTVTNVSAIVGNNGSGKTTTIYEILKALNGNFQPSFAFWEDGQKCYFNNFNLNIPGIRLEGEWNLRPEQTNKQVGTIYFSPFLDHKASAVGIDISADRYLREDLVNIYSTSDANKQVIISERLKRADYKRFINFQKSEFSNKIKEKYGIFNDEMYRVVFIRHQINANRSDGISFENTPLKFQGFLRKLLEKIWEEYDSFDRNWSNDSELFELNKKQFKNILLMDIFCLLIKLMEKHNTFLQEGFFNDEENMKSFLANNPSAIDMTKYWLNNYYYSKWNKHPLPDREVIKTLDFLFEYIDGLEFSKDGNYLNWSSRSLYFVEEKLYELLDLNEELLSALNNYYLQSHAEDRYEFLSVSELQYFASPEFADRKLSSGETALLNLYSRVYDYFYRHIISSQVVKKEDYYILFLDEADLGYHPEWKRSFVKTIIEFSKNLFKKLDVQVQIVFTTHDAISLSDIPNTNVIYLHSSSPGRILDKNSDIRPDTTFAANVNDLLGHSFFLNDLLIGDFARSKIDGVIDWINKNRENNGNFNSDEFEDIKKTIAIIEEPVLRNKLADMLSDVKIDDQFIQDMISKQSDYLRGILKRRRN